MRDGFFLGVAMVACFVLGVGCAVMVLLGAGVCGVVPTPTPAATHTAVPTPTYKPTPTVDVIVRPTATPTPPGAGWPIKWDARLDKYGVYMKALDPALKFWPRYVWLTEDGSWDGVPDFARFFLVPSFTEAGGATHMFGLSIEIDGSVPGGKWYRLWWPDRDPPDGQAGAMPEPSGWANFFTNARYDPGAGRGPYCMETLGGVAVCGGGQPYGGPHISIFTVWYARW